MPSHAKSGKAPIPATSLACTRKAAGALLLHQQGLRVRPRTKAKPEDVPVAVRRMHALQIDTINVIARSPYLVLHSRLGDYDPAWLDEAHARGELFEHASHAMCWLPREDWALYRGLLRDNLAHRRSYYARMLDWLKAHPKAVKHARRELEQHGPLPVSHFTKQAGPRESGGKGGWWDWREEKCALEFLFWTGEIVIPRREQFQRVYALLEQVYPDWDDAQAMPVDQARRELALRSACVLGVVTEPWLRDYFRFKRETLKPILAGLVESGELLPVELERARIPAYIHRDLAPLLDKARKGGLAPKRTALLSPFDPVVWDRDRLSGLFGFDYQISVYTPKAKREGYFELPVLSRGRMVGRLDPKAHRKDGMFEVRSLRLEPDAEVTDADWRELARELAALANWHSAPEVKVRKGVPASAASSLKGALRELM